MKIFLLFYSLFGMLLAQSYPSGGTWYQQPIPQGYGGQARLPGQPVPAGDQIQQREVDREIMQNDAEDQEQQRGVDAQIQQRFVEDEAQQRREDEVIQQGTGLSPG